VTDSELFAFMATFRSLTRVFPLRGEEHEINDVGASYFKAFHRFPLGAIQAGADRWIEQGKRFPKPAEWIDAIPRRTTEPPMETLSADDAAIWLQAEQMRWEDAPCICRECVAADVTEKPLRFVPEFTANDTDRRVKLGERVVTAGHWAHGQELARWYRARADFYNRCLELGLRRDVLQPKEKRRSRFQERMDAIFNPKVPA